MKKLLSVLLAVVMLLGCATVAFADGENITVSTGSNDAGSTLSYTNATIIIPSGVTYTNYGTIKLSGGAFIVNAGGAFENYGSFVVDDKTAVSVQGTFNNHITLPGSTTVTYPASTPTFDRAAHTVTYEFRYLLESAVRAEDDYLNISKYSTGSDVIVPYDDTLYVMVGAKEGDSYVNYLDTSRVEMWSGSGAIIKSSMVDSSRRGVFTFKPKSAASYEPVSLKYADVVTQFAVELPAKEGQYVVKTDKGEAGTVIVNYGEMLTVTVELDPEYEGSDVSLYVSGLTAPADKYGYFDINTVYADDGKSLIVRINDVSNGTVSQDGVEVKAFGIRAPFSMLVMGVMKKDTRDKFNSVLTYLKQIFDVFREIFESIKDALSGLFG